jgi:hypothetical protein
MSKRGYVPPKKPRRATLTFDLGEDHLSALDYAQRYYSGLPDKPDGFRHRAIKRSDVVRIGIALLLLRLTKGEAKGEDLEMSRHNSLENLP